MLSLVHINHTSSLLIPSIIISNSLLQNHVRISSQAKAGAEVQTLLGRTTSGSQILREEDSNPLNPFPNIPQEAKHW